MKQSKRLELSAECIKYWAKKAIDEGTSFKPFVEAHLEREATSNSFEKTAARGTKKNKNKQQLTNGYAQQNKMEKITISTTYTLKWYINDTYKVSICGNVFNTKRGIKLKRVLNGGSVGYWIGKEFVTLKELRKRLNKIETVKIPF